MSSTIFRKGKINMLLNKKEVGFSHKTEEKKTPVSTFAILESSPQPVEVPSQFSVGVN